MNLLDSIDKSTYTLLFPDNTEMSPYPSKDINSSTGGANQANYTHASNTTNDGSTAADGGVVLVATNSIPSNNPRVHHTILNMKTTLVNGSYSSSSNCDNDSSSYLEQEEKRPLVESEMKHGMEMAAVVGGNPFENMQQQYFHHHFQNSTGSYNIELPAPTGTLATSRIGSTVPMINGDAAVSLYRNQELLSTNSNFRGHGSSVTTSNWGPEVVSTTTADPFINSINLSGGSNSSVVNAYSEGQKVILPANYFVSEYADIFGNVANYDETDDVAKLPITSEESNKMFLIGLSSKTYKGNVEREDGDEDDDDGDLDDEAMDNEDNSPFQSATEEMTAEGEHDQDPLLVRAPPKQNVFHQFIRSAHKYSAYKDRLIAKHAGGGRRGSFQNNFHHHHHSINSSARDDCSSSSALIKEVNPIDDDCHLDKDGRDLSSIISSSSEDMRSAGNGSSRCSIGILLATISCFFFATSALIVKISSLHPMELLAVRGTIQGILVSPILFTTGNSLLGPSGSRSLLMARAVLGAVALVMGFASLHLLPLADAATVIFTSPVFVSIFACLCLGEVCSWFDVSMIALTLVGVLLVSKPSFSFISTGTWTGIAGTICGLIAAMLTALAFIVLRQLKQVHYSVVVFWFSSVLAMFGAVLTVALDGFTLPRTWPNIMECIGIGFCGFMGQILLTKALQSENALPIAVTRTFDIVLAFFYQITLLHDTPDLYSYLGSVLVVSCVLLTAFHRWYKESTKKKYTRVLKIPDDDEQQLEENHHQTSSAMPSTSSSTSVRNHHHHHRRPRSDVEDDYEEHLP